ncbi:hypothetical protein CALVIDRAFT_557481 [Calocera viscosa TUFC12733]|uniref:Uncharacterized protein n=1 Tax=Calocera viscosa (strain TUFC12733) TaxID=1330018 RepID=A0A167IEF5_CALVF|nr:hypothetical protein CALVIDRAFT_557481 [Calocera viscosa TUFC12733]
MSAPRSLAPPATNTRRTRASMVLPPARTRMSLRQRAVLNSAALVMPPGSSEPDIHAGHRSGTSTVGGTWPAGQVTVLEIPLDELDDIVSQDELYSIAPPVGSVTENWPLPPEVGIIPRMLDHRYAPRIGHYRVRHTVNDALSTHPAWEVMREQDQQEQDQQDQQQEQDQQPSNVDSELREDSEAERVPGNDWVVEYESWEPRPAHGEQ